MEDAVAAKVEFKFRVSGTGSKSPTGSPCLGRQCYNRREAVGSARLLASHGRINSMHSGLARQFPALLLGAMVVTGLWTRATTSQTVAQPAANTAAAAEKELEVAAARVREGKVDEALALIREKAGRHPEWLTPRLILARLLFNSNQAPAARAALELAAVESPDDPDVYLTFGTLSLGDGRASDAQLNFDRVLALLNTGRSNAEKTKLMRREALAGLASVAEARADWKTTQQHLNAWLELDSKNGRVRQRLGRALFHLGKTEDAFTTLTQAVKDEPALEPPGLTMAQLESQKGDGKKAEEWFDYAQGRTEKRTSSTRPRSVACRPGTRGRRARRGRRSPEA